MKLAYILLAILLCISTAFGQTPVTGVATVVPGEVIVRFKGQDTTPEDKRVLRSKLDGLRGRYHIRAERQLRGHRSTYHITTDAPVDQLVAELATRSDVEFVQPNYIYHNNSVVNDEYFIPYQWNLFNYGQTITTNVFGRAGKNLGDPITTGNPVADTGIVRAWDITTGSKGIAVADLDTGVDENHPDLVNNLWRAPHPFTVTVRGADVVCPAGTIGINTYDAPGYTVCNPHDDQGHGTHVIGIIGAQGNNGIGVSGVIPNVTLVAIKMGNIDGSYTSTSISDGVLAVLQLNAQFPELNLRVLNMSFGGVGLGDVLVQSSLQQITQQGTILIAAASGNDSFNLSLNQAQAYPAGYWETTSPNIIEVTALTMDGKVDSHANYGITKVNVAAPGDYILSTTTTYPSALTLALNYDMLAGTSMASPHVAGTAALVLSACDLRTWSELKSVLFNHVKILQDTSSKVTTGGIIDVYEAVKSCAKPQQKFTVQ